MTEDEKMQFEEMGNMNGKTLMLLPGTAFFHPPSYLNLMLFQIFSLVSDHPMVTNAVINGDRMPAI